MVVACGSSESGAAVGDITNFNIFTMTATANLGLQLKGVSALNNGYQFRIVPVSDKEWVAGTWTVRIQAAKGEDLGQALVTITVS